MAEFHVILRLFWSRDREAALSLRHSLLTRLQADVLLVPVDSGPPIDRQLPGATVVILWSLAAQEHLRPPAGAARRYLGDLLDELAGDFVAFLDSPAPDRNRHRFVWLGRDKESADYGLELSNRLRSAGISEIAPEEQTLVVARVDSSLKTTSRSHDATDFYWPYLLGALVAATLVAGVVFLGIGRPAVNFIADSVIAGGSWVIHLAQPFATILRESDLHCSLQLPS